MPTLPTLAVEHQQRLTDIEEEGIRAREDLQRDANRDREDVEREFQDAFQEIQRQRTFGEITDAEATQRLQELGRGRLDDLRELGIRTERSEEDLGIGEERARADAEARFTQARQEVIEEAEAIATAIRDALAPLISQAPATEAETALTTEAQQPAIAESTGMTAENTDRNQRET